MHNKQKDSPSFHRNIEPISNKLKEVLPDGQLNVLEIGSGSGQHACAFATSFPNLTVFPTDLDPDNLTSIDAWAKSEGISNVKAARILNVIEFESAGFESDSFDFVFCFNVIHISPWAVTVRLFELADRFTTDNGKIILYGPYRINGEHTSDSNVKFEGWLKAQSPEFGVRALEDVEAEAGKNGFSFVARHQMPANNFLVEFARK